MRVPTAAAIALTLLIGLATADTAAGAVTCTYKRGAYSNGAPLGVTPGGGPVNDPVFKAQWGLTKIHAPAAWARGAKGSGVKIAIVDTGVDLHHPDLAAKIVSGKDLTPAKSQGCAGPQDENGHGTHVAGIAAASTNNGIGVAGTAPGARIMPVRVLDASGSADDPTVIAGIRYAADHGAKVINLSLGGEPPAAETPQLNASIAKAVGYAYSKGALVVAAAGNESVPLCSYPGASNKAVCVAAVDRNGAPSFYSNFPVSPAGAVGVRAPGGTAGIDCEDSLDIWSTIWPGASDDCKGPGLLGGYDTLTGTSMATPFVSGLAAILYGKGLTNAQILACLKKTSSNKGTYDPVMGYGVVDADAATKTCKGSGGGGSSGGLKVSVTRERISRKRLARTRKVHVTVKANCKVSVALRARAGRHTLARKRVKLAGAGKRTATVRLSKRAARYVRRHKHARFSVRWSGGGKRGTARAR